MSEGRRRFRNEAYPGRWAAEPLSLAGRQAHSAGSCSAMSMADAIDHAAHGQAAAPSPPIAPPPLATLVQAVGSDTFGPALLEHINREICAVDQLVGFAQPPNSAGVEVCNVGSLSP